MARKEHELTSDEKASVQELEQLADTGAGEIIVKSSGTFQNSAVSFGDVSGLGSSTDNAVARFSGTGGDTIQNSGITIDDSDNIAGVTSITITGTPSAASDAATVDYVDTQINALNPKQAVVAATTANITLSGEQTIDGVSVTAGDRVLVQDQSTASENGIYVCSASSWSRSADADSWDELVSAYVFATQGTTNGDKKFLCTVDAGGTLDTTDVTWVLYGASTGLTTLNGETGTTQSFAVGTSGTDFAISSATNTHTFNLPDASGSARGAVTTGAQTIAGAKTFSSAPVFSTTTASKPLKVDAGKALTSGDITLTSEVTGVLPVANGGTNSSTALNSNRMIISSSGAIVEQSAITGNRIVGTDSNGLPVGTTATTDASNNVSTITGAATGMTIDSATNGNITVSPGGAGTTTIEAGSGGVTIQTDAGNADITLSPHGTGTVDLAASTDLSFNGTAILSDSAGTMTLSNVDALDATTSATIGANTMTLTNKTFDANGTGNSISNIDVADLADGTDGELITWDASGNATTVSVGTSGQVLTSNGAGAAPTFEDASGGDLPVFIPFDTNVSSYYSNNYSDSLDSFIFTTPTGNMQASAGLGPLKYKYISGTLQSASVTSVIFSSGYSFSGGIVQGGYYYVSGSNGSTGKIARCPITSTITSSGNWTELTISGTALPTSTSGGLVGYGDGKFWVLDGSSSYVYYTLSGTTLTSGGTVTVTGATYNQPYKTVVNETGIYAYFSAAPYVRFASFAGTLDGTKQAEITNYGNIALTSYKTGAYLHVKDMGSSVQGYMLLNF